MGRLLRASFFGLLIPVVYACGSSSHGDDDDDAGASGEGGSAGSSTPAKGGSSASSGRGAAGSGAGKGARGGASAGGSATGGSTTGGTAAGGSGNRGARGGTSSGGSGGSTGGTEDGAAGEPGGGATGVAGDGTEGGAAGAPGDYPVYDVFDDFSTTDNPGASWSYGWKATPDADFTLYPMANNSLGDERVTWVPNESIAYLLVGINRTAGDLGGDPGGTVFFHPGPSGETSVIRWTCPATRAYRLDAEFVARDNTTTTVRALQNGIEFFSSGLTTSNPVGVQSDLELVAGDTLDFGVDYGANENNNYDNTGIAVTITAE